VSQPWSLKPSLRRPAGRGFPGSVPTLKMNILVRIVTLISVATLALAVLWRSAPDYRMAICIVVSLGGIILAIRALSVGKLIWGLVFAAVLGIFTPFRGAQFSHTVVAALDMATLVLFAVSPFLLRKSATIPASSAGSLGTGRWLH